jgi:hypothetical protein
LSAAPAGLTSFKRQGRTMEQTLALISLASDIIAMAAAMTTLADTAIRYRSNRAKK